MKTYLDVMAQWPSLADLAADIGVNLATVNVWKHRRNLPPDWWLKTAEAARKRGYSEVTLEALARIRANRVTPAERAA